MADTLFILLAETANVLLTAAMFHAQCAIMDRTLQSDISQCYGACIMSTTLIDIHAEQYITVSYSMGTQQMEQVGQLIIVVAGPQAQH